MKKKLLFARLGSRSARGSDYTVVASSAAGMVGWRGSARGGDVAPLAPHRFGSSALWELLGAL